MLTEFFNTCSQDDEAKTYLYKEFPEYYVWIEQGKCWNKRKSIEVTSQVNGANLSKMEQYYLRLSLNHVKWPTSFQDLLTYNGV